jgi:predicted Ser/Thr protein kinase
MSDLDRIDHYRVTEKIGSGGMGEVYRAQDERLGRSVAIKLLPLADTVLARRQARLVREAQAASQLNHPGIVTIHDVGRHGDRNYLVMELVDGRSLGELRGKLVPEQIASIGLQAAEALAAAHARGILHRDIKPDNMMVTADRRLKILDFGLAKLGDDPPAEPPPLVRVTAAPDPGVDGATLSASRTYEMEAGSDTPPSLTRPGAIVGTPAYMSPEQASRRPTDERSEIYSLGLVLHELCTGRRALERGTVKQTMAAARSAAVPRLDDRRLPRSLVRVIERALAPDPDDRFADMTEMAAALRASSATRPTGRWIAAGALAAAAAGGALFLLRGDSSAERVDPVAGAFAITGNRRLTFDAGCEQTPSLTPDGRAILFAGVFERDVEIIRLDLADGSRRRLSRLPGWDTAPIASPDGRQVAFVHFGERGRELHVAPESGGPSRFVGAVSGNPGWLPGGELLYGDESGRILRLDLSRQAAEPLSVLPNGMAAIELRAFPDGAIAFLARVAGPDPGLLQLGVIEPDGSVRLLDPGPTVSGPAGLAVDDAGRGIYYAVRTPGGVEQLVWRSRQGGEPVALAGAPVSRSGMDVDATRLVISTCRERRIAARLRGVDQVEPLEQQPEWAAGNLAVVDAERALVGSDRSGSSQIWLLEQGREPRVVIAEASDQPAYGAGQIAWVGREPGEPGIQVRALEGGEPRRLTEQATDVQPLLSHDGETVYFLRVGGAEGGRGHSVPAAGGAVAAVTPARISELAVSPVADLLAFIPLNAERNAVMIGPPGGPFSPLALPAGTYWSPRFSRDGKRLLLVRGAVDVVEVPLDGGAARVVWYGGSSAVWQVEEAPDGDGWMAALAVYDGDIVMLDGRFQ